MYNLFQNISTQMPNRQLLMKSQNLTESERKILMQLIREYNRKSIETGKCFSRKQLKSMDLIDIRNLVDSKATNEEWEMPAIRRTAEEIRYIQQNYWLGLLPCFETGVIQVNTGAYLYYQMQNLDIENKNYRIFLKNYAYNHTGWEPGMQMTCTYQFGDPPKPTDTNCSITCNFGEKQTYVDHYLQISPDAFRWNRTERLIWKKYLTILNDINSDMNLHESLSTIFINIIPKINTALNQNRPKLEKAKSSTKQNHTKTTYEPNTEQKQKRIRVIGQIRIQSEKPPKEPKPKNVIHYKTAAWKTRGHTRTYKNGKTVWIKETVHKRKCMQDSDVPQTVIRFRKQAKTN